MIALKALLREIAAFFTKVTGITFSTSTGDMILFSILGLVAVLVILGFWFEIAKSSGFVFSTVFIVTSLYCFYFSISVIVDISLRIHAVFVGILVILAIPFSLGAGAFLGTVAKAFLQKIKILKVEEVSEKLT